MVRISMRNSVYILSAFSSLRPHKNCIQAQKLSKCLIEECADFVRLSQSCSYENLSYCPNVIAYLKAMVLYVELDQLRQRLCIETGTVSKMLSNWKLRGYIVPDLASTPTNLDD